MLLLLLLLSLSQLAKDLYNSEYFRLGFEGMKKGSFHLYLIRIGMKELDGSKYELGFDHTGTFTEAFRI